MFKTLKAVRLQKNQLIKDVKNAVVKANMKGKPEITGEINKEAEIICPTGAIKSGEPYNGGCLDLSKCIFCSECERVCSNIHFTNNYKTASTSREALILPNDSKAVESNKRIKKILGRSLKLRQVSAGGCNACEMELNAASNANFDIGRFGIDFVASPRHADGIVITGPITKNMAYALEATYNAVSEPKIIILVGACALSKGIFKDSSELDRSFLENHTPDLYIPGCPVHPLTFINAILEFLER